MRRLVVGAAALAFAGLPAAAALAATKTVKVADNYFVRDGGTPTVSVKKGTKVRFRWTGDAPHNVVAQSGPVRFASKVQSSGTYTRTVRKKGTYRLVCTIHADEMKLTLKVR